jgi:hypothetical protein
MSGFHGVMMLDGAEIIACCSGDGDFTMMPDAQVIRRTATSNERVVN